MAINIKLYFPTGTTSQNNAYIGSSGEVTIDRQVQTLHLHDGETEDGHALPLSDDIAAELDPLINRLDGHDGDVNDLNDLVSTINNALADALDVDTVGDTVVGLDGESKIAVGDFPDTISEGRLAYQGSWDADANDPTLDTPPAEVGVYYIVSTDGVFDGLDFVEGDWIVATPDGWEKIDNTQSVTSVVGRTGTVEVTADDVSLDNLNNTSDSDKPVSDALQVALDEKADRDEPNLTGAPTAPTADSDDDSQQMATTAFVMLRLSNVDAAVTSLAGRTGAVTLDKDDVGLDAVQNQAPAGSRAIREGDNDRYVTPQNMRSLFANMGITAQPDGSWSLGERQLPLAEGEIPGPDTLSEGGDDAGWYGEVAGDDFITYQALSDALGVTQGTLQHNDDSAWLKFAYQGEIYFIPKKPIRSGISWETLYQAGAVYGNGETGYNPSGPDTPQDAQVTIGGIDYTVRLIEGGPQDPIGDESGFSSGWGDERYYDSEWNRLLYRVHDESSADAISHDTSDEPSDRWVEYTETELGSGSDDPGSACWTLETNGNNPDNRIARGGSGVSYSEDASATSRNEMYGWRPVLIPQTVPE